MANRKKSGGQSQGQKQAAGGGASRPPNPQATNKPRSVATAHRDCSNPSDPTFPTMHDGSRQGSRITNEDKAKFIRQQCEDEMELERWSKPFGSKLLPGMHSAPINAVPKSTPGKFRLINDQRRGPHALNSTIPKSQVKVQLDTVHDLGNELLAARNKYFPAKQARLLELWDELGIPHDEDKQLSGPSLPILGYHVDANAMTVKVPDEKKAKVVELLRSNARAGKPYTVNELQSIAGSVGSTLSLYPRLRPGLRVLFNEMAVQEGGTTKLKVTEPVAGSLSSLADLLEHAPPVPIQHQKEKVRRIGA